MAMDRQEAARVLREILRECDGSLLMSSVSILRVGQNSGESSSFELRINCVLDDCLRKCISDVLERHNLAMKELESSVIIYRPSV